MKFNNMISTHVEDKQVIQGNRGEDSRKSLAEIQRSSWKGSVEGGNGMEYKSAWMKRKNETRSGTRGERHGDTLADGEKRRMHGGRANHVRERG